MNYTKTQETSFVTSNKMRLLRGVDTYSYNIKKTGEQGSILLFFLPWIWLLFCLCLGIYFVGTHVNNAIALEARLDVCALEIVHDRKTLFEYLADSNSILEKTKIAIYALRSSELIPVVGVVGELSEPALLSLASTVKYAQNARIFAEQIKDIQRPRCKNSPYSNLPAFCSFFPIALDNFHRESTLFPDVPGRISFDGNTNPLAKVSCEGIFSAKIYTSKVYLNGDASLQTRDFNYAYE